MINTNEKLIYNYQYSYTENSKNCTITQTVSSWGLYYVFVAMLQNILTYSQWSNNYLTTEGLQYNVIMQNVIASSKGNSLLTTV